MRKVFQILLAAIVFAMFAPTSAYESDSEYLEYESILKDEYGQGYNAMKRLTQLNAYKVLAEQAYAVQVDSSSTVRNVCELDEVANFRVQTALRNLRYVKEFQAPDGSYHAIVRLYLRGAPNSLSSAVLNQNVQVKDFLPPKSINMVSGSYTGVIIDCRGQGLSKAIAPAIKCVDGREIYAYQNVGYQTATDKGMIDYSTSMDSGVERACNAPLRITAVRVSGKCDVVVSTEDADKILAANQSTHFLNECAVVFVR